MTENTSIKEQIRKLVQLQKLDSQILNLKKEKQDKPKEHAELEERFNAKKLKADEIKKEIETLLLKRKDKELELSSKEAAINKSQQQLYTLKTNKEYTAMLKEIEGLKADKSVIEDELLVNFDTVDSKKDELARETDNLKLEEERLHKEGKVLNDRVTEIDQELATLDNKRKEVVLDIEEKILSGYEKVLENRAGLAIVPVKNDTCQGCFMSARAQVINEIKMYDKIITCQMCTRLLYLEEELGN
ncbi:MAG: hypothetical protein KJ593_08500 [Candidatus Omnitrophica bacterium]|nr:hypothetical protein [Candidatus Omnitrophota bacterium]